MPIYGSPSGGGGPTRDQYRAWSTGLDLAAGTIGMGLLGFGIDYLAGTAPVWTIVLALIGLVGGFYRFIREALALNKEQTARYAKRRPPPVAKLTPPPAPPPAPPPDTPPKAKPAPEDAESERSEGSG